VLDSAQLFDLADEGWKTWADLGSGGGFPGLVIAILAAQYNPDATVTLVESDQRKSAFLATVARDTGLTAKILAERIESIAPLNADIVSARALASLDVLLKYAKQHLATDGLALFPKGGNQQDEIAQAIEKWQFSYEQPKSITDADAVILAVRGVSRV
ncbi:MAG: 16S rRNA (guanine(527)-N(7))-methyltransferase RsmG, partial [Albidovulum sp.]